MGRGGRQGSSVASSEIDLRYRIWADAADRYDENEDFSRTEAWKDALPWQSMSREEQQDFLEGMIRAVKRGKGDAALDIRNVCCSQSLILTRDSVPFGPVVTRVFSPESIYYPAETFGPSGNFLYTSSAEDGEEAQEAAKIIEMLSREGYSVAPNNLPDFRPKEPAEKREPPQGRQEFFQSLIQEGLSEDEARDRIAEEHWTAWHPDRELWTPHQRALAQGMSQEAYEAVYGREAQKSDGHLQAARQRLFDRLESYSDSEKEREWQEALPWLYLSPAEQRDCLAHELGFQGESLSSSGVLPLGGFYIARNEENDKLFDVWRGGQFSSEETFTFDPRDPDARSAAAEKIFGGLEKTETPLSEECVFRWAPEELWQRIEQERAFWSKSL